VTGPIIIAIGLNLSVTAISSCSSNWPVALVAIAIVIICNIWGRGMIKIIPILLGVVGSYLFAAILGIIDWTPVLTAPVIGSPIVYRHTVFSIFTGGNLNTSLLITSVITIVPIAFATMMEHIGDISAISSTVNRNYIKDPGLHRTLTGDGLATAIASLFGAPANTTYGENTGVLTLTRVFDPMVIRLAAVLAIVFSFFPKFAAVIEVMPSATVGGISLILYGMISAVGVRNIVETNVDFSKSRNVLIAALILVLSIGINYSEAGAIVIPMGSITITFSGLATGSLVGIILNAILPGKDYKFEEDEPNRTGVSFEMIHGETLADEMSKNR
jgi:uracil permease